MRSFQNELVIPFCTLPAACPYLAGRSSRVEYRYIDGCDVERNEDLIRRGWRRFGNYFSRPICGACQECLSVRIVVDEFKPSRSQRRVARVNSTTRALLRRPLLSDEHLFLYEKYHRFMEARRGWTRQELGFSQYFNLYIEGANEYGYELALYVGERLVCVDLIDLLEEGLSSIYCFYDPDFARLSLGKFSLLNELYLARSRGLKYLYLGYLVRGCASLAYKDEFYPRQILRGSSAPGEAAPLWLDE